MDFARLRFSLGSRTSTLEKALRGRGGLVVDGATVDGGRWTAKTRSRTEDAIAGADGDAVRSSLEDPVELAPRAFFTVPPGLLGSGGPTRSYLHGTVCLGAYDEHDDHHYHDHG